MKQRLTTGMLLIGAVLLGAFIWFFERDDESSHQQQLRNQTVFAIYPDSIASILLERGDVRIECSKESGSWRLVQPADAPVDIGIVEKMIAGMARVERGELISAETLRERGLTPADYGLDEPRAKITFQNNRGTFTWLIGRDAPLGETLYIMPAAGGDIVAAPKTLLHLIPEDPAWIRDHALFRNELLTVRGLDLRRPAGFVQLRQTENNGWMMQQPHKGRADVSAVHQLIETVLSARIQEFVTDEKADLTVYGLEEPAVELTLFTLDGQAQTLRIGKANPDQPEARYAKWMESDSIFTLPAEWVNALDLKNDSLRSRHLLGALPARITELTLSYGEKQTHFVQTNGQWQITRPARWNADPARINALLQTLAQAMVLDFVDNPTAEQTQTITDAPWVIVFSTDQKTHTLRIADPDRHGQQLLQRDEESSLYIVADGLMDDAFANPLFFKERTVLRINPDHIEKITQQTGEEKVCAQKTENSFSAMERDQAIDSDALFGLTTELMALRAERYVQFNPESLAIYGLDNPPFRLTVSLSGTNTLGQAILLGTATDGGRFAMLQGQPVVFVLPGKTAQILTQRLTKPLENQTEEIERP